MLDFQVVVYHSILCRHCARERTVLHAYVAGERAVDRADVAVSTDVAGRVDGSGNVDIAVNAKRAVKVGGSVDFKPAKFSTACFERAELAETGSRHRSVFYHGVVARRSDFNLRPERTVCSGEVAGYVKIASDRRVAGYISCVGSECVGSEAACDSSAGVRREEAACDRSAGVRRECAAKRRLSGYFEAVKFRVFVVRAEHGAYLADFCRIVVDVCSESIGVYPERVDIRSENADIPSVRGYMRRVRGDVCRVVVDIGSECIDVCSESIGVYPERVDIRSENADIPSVRCYLRRVRGDSGADVGSADGQRVGRRRSQRRVAGRGEGAKCRVFVVRAEHVA